MDLKSKVLVFWSEAKLQRKGVLRFLARGNSMNPFIREGDLVEVVPINGMHHKPLRIGDIILCQTSHSISGLTIHRVIKKQKNQGRTVLVTQGDAAISPDQPVYLEDVLGKIVSVEWPTARTGSGRNPEPFLVQGRDGKKIRLDSGLYSWLGFALAQGSPLTRLFNHRRVRKYLGPILRIIKIIR